MNTNDPHPNRLVIRGIAALLACLKHHPKALREVVATAAFAPNLAEHDAAFAELGVKTRIVGPIELAQTAEAPCEDVCALTMRPDFGLARISDFAEWRSPAKVSSSPTASPTRLTSPQSPARWPPLD